MSELLEFIEPEPPEPTQLLTEQELDPKNWEIATMETDCGYACTPDGCRGHDTDIPEKLIIGGYELKFPWCDEWPRDANEAYNASRILAKLQEVFALSSNQHLVVSSDWLPTVDNINALPRPIRDYIHQLEVKFERLRSAAFSMAQGQHSVEDLLVVIRMTQPHVTQEQADAQRERIKKTVEARDKL